MKKINLPFVFAFILLLSLNSCTRFYGIKKPIEFPMESNDELNRASLSEEKMQLPILINDASIKSREQDIDVVLLANNEKTSTIITPMQKNILSAHDVKQNVVPVTKVTSAPSTPEEKMDGFAVAGFVTGLVGMLFAGIVLGIVAIILSSIALTRIKKSDVPKRGKGLAVAGLILGILGLVLSVILLAVLL